MALKVVLWSVISTVIMIGTCVTAEVMVHEARSRSSKIMWCKIGVASTVILVVSVVAMAVSVIVAHRTAQKHPADTVTQQTSESVNVDPNPAVPVRVESLFNGFEQSEIDVLAKCVWGEARGVESMTEQSAVVWCVLNRSDKFGESPSTVVTQPMQFNYDSDFPVVDDYGRDLRVLVVDVLNRWVSEKNGCEEPGRTLPSEYLWFGGDGERNYFRDSYSTTGNIWDWRLVSPYE